MTQPEQYIYEVSADIDNSIVEEWRKWIVDHVNVIVNLEKGNLFSKGNIMEVNNSIIEPNSDKCQSTTFVIQYYATSDKSIPIYIEKYSAELRKDGVSRFADKMKLTRRIMIEKKSIHTPPQTSTFGYVF